MMKNSNITDFYNYHKKYSYLKSIFIQREDNENCNISYVLSVILSKDPLCNDNDKFLLIKFKEVKQVRINEFDGIYSLQVNIVDISDYQLEGIHYKVKEEEYEIFSFCCDTFEYEEII